MASVPCVTCGVQIPVHLVQDRRCPKCGSVVIPGDPPPIPKAAPAVQAPPRPTPRPRIDPPTAAAPQSAAPTHAPPRPTPRRSTFSAAVDRRFKPATSLLDIFDWKFEKYLTPWIVRATWILCVGICALWIILGLIAIFMVWLPEMEVDAPRPTVPATQYRIRSDVPTIPGWLTMRLSTTVSIISGSVFVVIFLLWVRVVLEMAIVVFNIATTLTSIDAKFEDRAD